MNKQTKNRILREFQNEDMRHCLLKLMLECWNAETPHFGGVGSHRYEGKSQACVYCNRPRNWAPINAGVTAGDLLDKGDN